VGFLLCSCFVAFYVRIVRLNEWDFVNEYRSIRYFQGGK
jgi:hypothetical protein